MNHRPRAIFLVLCFIVVLVLFNYGVGQEQFNLIIASYSILFGIAFLINFRYKYSWNLRQWLWICIIVRFTLLFNTPGLSDDVYRFIWDGEMMWKGLNPYLYLPEDILGPLVIQDQTYQQIFDLLNSQNYYSVYPPAAQVTFAVATLFPVSSIKLQIIVLKFLLLGGEAIAMWTLMRLLKLMNKDPFQFLWYGLNPLVIVEVMGNLHYEGLMCAVIGLALWQAFKYWPWRTAISLSTAFALKLHAAFAGPFIWKYFYPKRSHWIFLLVSVVGTCTWFAPFYNPGFMTKFSQSLDLYFQSFEFNASIYYLVRWVGWQIKGYNMIQVIGPYLMIIPIVTALVLLLKQRPGDPLRCIHAILFSMTAYFLCTTTLHPWYIITLVFLSVLSNYKYPLLWSFVVVWSYSHYQNGLIGERWGWIIFEYVVLVAFMLYEFINFKGKAEFLVDSKV